MKIKYDKPINLIEFVNESNYIAGNKKRIFEKRKYPKYSSFKKDLLTCIGYILLLILGILFYLKTGEVVAKILCYVFGIIILIMLYSFYYLRKIYLITKKSEFTGVLTIDKNGIVDEDSFAKFCYKWENVSYMISGKHSFNIFFSKNNGYLRLPIDLKNDLVGAVEKYSDAEIIDLTIND